MGEPAVRSHLVAASVHEWLTWPQPQHRSSPGRRRALVVRSNSPSLVILDLAVGVKGNEGGTKIDQLAIDWTTGTYVMVGGWIRGPTAST
jgi:hypothetical protein